MLPLHEGSNLFLHAGLARNEIMLTSEQLLNKELQLID